MIKIASVILALLTSTVIAAQDPPDSSPDHSDKQCVVTEILKGRPGWDCNGWQPPQAEPTTMWDDVRDKLKVGDKFYFIWGGTCARAYTRKGTPVEPWSCKGKWEALFPVVARTMKERKWKDEPIGIISVNSKDGRAVSMGATERDNEDWLRDLTINIENTSSKKIVFVELYLNFTRPEGDPEEAVAAFPIMFGTPPKLVGPSSEKLKPKETWEASLSSSDYDLMLKLLAETGYTAAIKDVEIITGDVVFEDGSKWSAGKLSARARP